MANVKALDWGVVVNAPESDPKAINEFLGVVSTDCICKMRNATAYGFAGIEHIGEKDPIRNVEKTPHVHIVLHFGQDRTQQDVILWLSSLLNVPCECVSARPVRNLRGAVRYLCHLDNPEKQAYPTDLIVANSNWVDTFLECDDTHYIVEAVTKRGYTPSTFLIEKGKKWYNSNRNILMDVYRDFKTATTAQAVGLAQVHDPAVKTF